MYHSLLTRRYLTSKVMPLLASLAVVLCTAMVLITWSVMGGFLKMLTESGRSLIGDVRIAWPNVGFAHYDELVLMLEEDEMVGAAAPIIETFGVLTLPDTRIEGVLIRGVDGASFSRVTTYEDTLWWRPVEEPLPKDKQGADPRLDESYEAQFTRLYNDGLNLKELDPVTGEVEPAMVLGIEVGGWNVRTSWGGYLPWTQAVLGADGSVGSLDTFVPRDESLTLRVFPLDTKGQPMDVVTRVMPVANEFESGLYDIDRQTVLVNFDALQRMLRMHEALRLIDEPDPLAFPGDDPTEPETVVDPARATAVLVRHADENGNAIALKERCREIYAEFAAAHPGEVPSPTAIGFETWEDANRTMIAAVKKETGLVLMIFTFISFTAVFLVFAIFWAMISEKTKDIGVLRALGASRMGVAWVWLRYGLAIGVVGSIFGGVLAWAIVTNINEIHEGIASTGRWAGEAFTGTAWNWYIWDPSVYVFKEIPHQIVPWKAAVVLTGGLISCVVGALIPATRAARMHPVKALRFE